MRENEKFAEISSKLKDIFKDKVEDVILFGSCARGDFTENSDVDILVVINDEEIEEEVRRVVYSFIPVIKRLISVKVINRDLFENMKKAKFSLIQTIEREGVRIG